MVNQVSSSSFSSIFQNVSRVKSLSSKDFSSIIQHPSRFTSLSNKDFSSIIHSVSKPTQSKKPELPSLKQIFEKNTAPKVEKPRPLNMREVRQVLAQKRHEAAKVALTPSPADYNTIERVLAAYDTYEENLIKAADEDYKAENELLSEQFSYTSALAEACREIKDILETNSSKIDHAKMQTLREKLSDALSYFYNHYDEYNRKGLKQDLNDAFGNFLQRTSFQLRTQAAGMSTLEEIGSHALQYWRQPPIHENANQTATQLADSIEKVFDNMPADHWEGGLNYIIWALKNIAEAFLAFIDNKIPGCHTFYNSYKSGNVDMWIGDFVVNGKTIRTHIGPGPMNDPALLRGQLDWEEKMGIPHVIHTLEFNEKRGETCRLEKMRDLTAKRAKNHIGVQPALSLMGTPYDGKIAKAKKEFKDITSVDDFHDKLQKALLGSSPDASSERGALSAKNISNTIPKNIKHYDGFALPELDDNDIKEAIKTSKRAFRSTLGREAFDSLNTKEKQRLCSAMSACFNALLSIRAMMNLAIALESLPEERKEATISATIERACKQCADRGPLANGVLVAFTKLIENGKLEEKDMQQIIGLLVGRAMIAGPDRKMVAGRRQPFIDLFRIIGKNQAGFVRELKRFAGAQEGQESPIKFMPSNIDAQEE